MFLTATALMAAKTPISSDIRDRKSKLLKKKETEIKEPRLNIGNFSATLCLLIQNWEKRASNADSYREVSFGLKFLHSP